MACAAVGEMRVALVGHQPDFVFLAKGENLLEFIRRNDTRRDGLLGELTNDHARSRSDGFFDGGGFYAEAFFGAGLHNNRLAAGVFHDVGIADPVGRGDDDFVAGFESGRLTAIEDGMLAADVDDALLGFVGGAEFALVPVADGFAQGHDAGRGGVFGFIFVDGLDGALS